MSAPVTIRPAEAHDAAALSRLAALDSASPPRGAVLLAEVEGELWAALPLDGGPAIGLPFIARGQAAGPARPERAGGMGVTATGRIALRRDQHVLAQRGQVATAERAPVGGGLAALCPPDGPPAGLLGLGFHVTASERAAGKVSRSLRRGPPAGR